MNYVDYFILAVIAYFLIRGLLRGFFSEVLGFIGVIAALICATKYMSNLSVWIDRLLDIPPVVVTVLSFVIIFFAVVFAFQFLAHLFERFFKRAQLGWLEKLGGAGFGFLKGATIVSLLLLFISVVPFGTQLVSGLPQSKLNEPVRSFAPSLFNLIMEVVPQSKTFYMECKESLEKLSATELAKDTKSLLKALQNHEAPGDVPASEPSR
jgi:membrane protein required for colicin V production